MAAEQVNGFADNWAYLRTELYWLERLLIAAVAKQQKESKEIDRVARSKADRATSHWWKGIIASEGTVAYDEYRQPTSKTTHVQQVELQIKAAQKAGVVLALPLLRDRLGLNQFEKNVVLMSLAPEVNRRYAQLYRYLQGDESHTTDLPTLDLALRLLSKNDQEWRSCRNYLVSKSRLTRYRLLQFLPCTEATLLNAPLKLTDALINYLLADQPTASGLEDLLRTHVATDKISSQASSSVSPAPHPDPSLEINMATLSPSDTPLPVPQVKKAARTASLVFLHRSSMTKQWSDLVLPQSVLASLTHLETQIQGYLKAQQQWQLHPSDFYQPGSIVLLTGTTPLSQLLAVSALATALQTSLWQIDLATIMPTDYGFVLDEIRELAPTVLFIQSAEYWLKRSSLLAEPALRKFWAERHQKAAVTFLAVAQPEALPPTWRSQFDHWLDFPPLDETDRWLLWQKAFPAQVPIEATINWKDLAEKLILNEAQIRSIVQSAIGHAAAVEAQAVGLSHIMQALEQRGWRIDIQPIEVASPQKTRRKSRRKSEPLS
ncbi:MAG: hypothetical protein MUF72_19005 [Elainella sp. Prado103]|jgi:hypothetical protein|nr:hypothetical protein [Elainella sp. Prado103]